MEFLAFLQLRLFVAMGWHMQALVVSWYVYALTHDPLMLALIGLAEAVPAIGLALPMGYVVDKMDKRTGIRIAVVMIISSGVASAFLVQPWVAVKFGSGVVVAGLLAMIFINGSARAMYSPSMFTALGHIVPRDEIARASALSSSVWQGAMIAGPLLGGLIYGIYGVGVAAIVFVCLMILGGIGSLRLTPKPPVEQTERRSMKQDLTLGIRFIFSRPVILYWKRLDDGVLIVEAPYKECRTLHVVVSGRLWRLYARVLG
ncbi:MAG: MFS transporter [Candidatus Kapabacteria bacterium]|nr:MFS transporter [Candidatus Kapabacteria bacterium]